MLCRAFKGRGRHFNVVACAPDRKDLLKQIAEHKPDVALIGIDLANEPAAGFQALRQLRLARSSTRAILTLDSPKPTQVIEAFSQGARAVFCKDEGFEALCKCIQCVHAGKVWADSNQLEWVVRALEEWGPARIVSAAGTALLTKREEQIVGMVAEGLQRSEISKSLGLSPNTVRNHLFNIYKKLGVSSRVELILYVQSKRSACQILS